MADLDTTPVGVPTTARSVKIGWLLGVVAVLLVAVGATAGWVLVSRGATESSRTEWHPIRFVPLPPPKLDSVSLRHALQKRISSRTFDPRPLDSQTLSNLLWSANGVNRPENGGRTAPSAYDWRHVDLYLADARGVWLYDATRHGLGQLSRQDLRPLTGMQDFVDLAPLTIVLVSDEGKMDPKEPAEMKSIFSGVSAGAIAQNVYLYAANAGLNVVVRGSVDRPVLHEAMRLRKDQKIVVAQTVGFPP